MFFGSFWHAFGYMNNPSNLDNTLKQANLTPEQLLDTDNIVNEVKQSRSELLNFLKKNTHFTHALINYAIQMPDVEGNDEKKLYKYPFISSEIFSNYNGLDALFFDADEVEEEPKSESEEEEEEQNEVENETPGEPQENEDSTKEETEAANETPSEPQESNESTETPEAEETSETPGADSENAGAAPSESTQNETQASKVTEEGSDGEVSPQRSEKSQKSKPKRYTRKDLLSLLLSFITNESTLNDTSAGYFYKIINNLLNSEGKFLQFIADKPEVLSQLVAHIRTKSVCEVVLKLLTTVGIGSDSKEDAYVEQRKTLLTLLQEKFLSGDSFERENIAHIMHEVVDAFIRVENQYSAKCPACVQTFVLEDSFIETFFKVIVNPDSSSASIGYAANVISCLVTFHNSKTKSKNNRNSSNHHTDEDDVCNVAPEEDKLAFPGEKIFLEYLPQLLTFVQAASSGSRFTTSYGAEIVPFGIGKLKVVELIGHLFKSEQASIISFLANNSVYPILLELMASNPWNNLLHIQIDKVVQESITITINGSNEAVTSNLFGRTFNLLDFIATKSQEETSKPGLISKNIRQGHIGYLTNFGRKIKEATSCTTLTELKENSTAWNTYMSTQFETITKREGETLGGDNPKNKKEEDIDNSNGGYEIDIQKIYEKFNDYFKKGKTSKDDNLSDSKDDYENEDGGEEINEEEGIDNEKLDHASFEEEEITIEEVKTETETAQQVQELQKEENFLDYAAHTYWKVQNHHNIDQLMDEL